MLKTNSRHQQSLFEIKIDVKQILRQYLTRES